MKIGFDSSAATFAGTYCPHLVKMLAKYAPEHEYVVDKVARGRVDIYHSFTTPVAQGLPVRGVRRVVTVRDLNFLRFPQMYGLFDRLIRIRLYKQSCRTASCVIALNREAKEELVERLGIDRRKIEVFLPLGVHPPSAHVAETECETVRRKYALPSRYILTVGVPESRRNLIEIFDALRNSGAASALVVCGRRTAYSDFLLRYARATGDAWRIAFVYEPSPTDLPAVFRMAEAYVAVPDPKVQASVLPIVEAMRSGVPVVLADTPAHRETAADAAVYVDVDDEAELAGALKSVLCDERFRSCLVEREKARAELFSEYAVVRRLADIYSSL